MTGLEDAVISKAAKKNGFINEYHCLRLTLQNLVFLMIAKHLQNSGSEYLLQGQFKFIELLLVLQKFLF